MAQHVRHKPPMELQRPRELVLVCPPLRSGVNLSRLVRLCGCAGIREMIVCSAVKVDANIARDAIDYVNIVRRRSLDSVLDDLRREQYRLVALEQTDASHNLFEFSFPQKTALIVGNERTGLSDEHLGQVDECVEIPVYGRPFSYNVVTATTMAVYEYCRQFPHG